MKARPLIIAFCAFAALAGMFAGGASAARAQPSWKWCSEVDSQGRCITCWQNQACSATDPVCCQDPVEA